MQQRDVDTSSFEAVPFTNITSEDFTWSWDSKPYSIKAGETKYYPVFLAKHLAKHLIDREIIKKNEKMLRDPVTREDMENRILGEVIVKEEKKVQQDYDLTARVEAEVEEEFVGLKEKTAQDLTAMKWTELRAYAAKKGVFKTGMTKEEVLEALN